MKLLKRALKSLILALDFVTFVAGSILCACLIFGLLVAIYYAIWGEDLLDYEHAHNSCAQIESFPDKCRCFQDLDLSHEKPPFVENHPMIRALKACSEGLAYEVVAPVCEGP